MLLLPVPLWLAGSGCGGNDSPEQGCGDLTGRYPVASELRAEFLIEDLGNGSVRGLFRGVDPREKYYESVFEMTYTSQTIGSELTAQSREDAEPRSFRSAGVPSSARQ